MDIEQATDRLSVLEDFEAIIERNPSDWEDLVDRDKLDATIDKYREIVFGKVV